MDTYERLLEIETKETLDDDDLSHIISASTERDASVRYLAAELLCFFDSPEAKQTLFTLLDDPDELVRTNACDSLGSFPGKDTYALLLKRFEEDSDPLTRAYALIAINDLLVSGTEIEQTPLLHLLSARAETETDAMAHISICTTLYLLGCHEMLDDILAYLTEDPQTTLYCFAIRQLITILGPENREKIEAAVRAISDPPVSIAEAIRAFYEAYDR